MISYGSSSCGIVTPMAAIAKILLLGSGELGREFVISAKRLGAYVVACDSYAGAPAMVGRATGSVAVTLNVTSSVGSSGDAYPNACRCAW